MDIFRVYMYLNIISINLPQTVKIIIKNYRKHIDKYLCDAYNKHIDVYLYNA